MFEMFWIASESTPVPAQGQRDLPLTKLQERTHRPPCLGCSGGQPCWNGDEVFWAMPFTAACQINIYSWPRRRGAGGKERRGICEFFGALLRFSSNLVLFVAFPSTHHCLFFSTHRELKKRFFERKRLFIKPQGTDPGFSGCGMKSGAVINQSCGKQTATFGLLTSINLM